MYFWFYYGIIIKVISQFWTNSISLIEHESFFVKNLIKHEPNIFASGRCKRDYWESKAERKTAKWCKNVPSEEKHLQFNIFNDNLIAVLTGLRDGWATCRPVRVTGASGRAGGCRAQGALRDTTPLRQHRCGSGGGGDGAGRRARAEPVEAMKRMKAMEAGLVRQLLEPPSQEPVLARQLLLVYGMLTLAVLQIL